MTRDAIADLTKERRAAEALRDTLSKMPEVDESTLRDTIEGETGLHEAIAEVVALLTDTENSIFGLTGHVTAMQIRLARYKQRADFLRAAIEQAMVVGEVSRLELPTCTLSLGRRAPGLVITDEAMIPAEFWKAQDPALDKAALKEALKDKKAIPGATLGNGSVSLTIRRA